MNPLEIFESGSEKVPGYGPCCRVDFHGTRVTWSNFTAETIFWHAHEDANLALTSMERSSPVPDSNPDATIYS